MATRRKQRKETVALANDAVASANEVLQPEVVEVEQTPIDTPPSQVEIPTYTPKVASPVMQPAQAQPVQSTQTAQGGPKSGQSMQTPPVSFKPQMQPINAARPNYESMGIDLNNPKTASQSAFENYIKKYGTLTEPKTANQAIYVNTPSTPGATPTQTTTTTPQNNGAVDWQKFMLDRVMDSENRRKALEEQDAEAQKQEAARQRIAAIAEAMGSIANMYGVQNNGYNMQVPSASKYISDDIANDKRLRLARMDKMDTEIDRIISQYASLKNKADYNENTAYNAETRRMDVERKERQGTESAAQKKEAFDYKKQKDKNDDAYRWANLNSRNSNSAANRQASAEREAARIEERAKEREEKAIARSKKEHSDAVKDLYSNDNWDSTKAAMYEAMFGTSNPDSSTMTQEQRSAWMKIQGASAGERAGIVNDYIKKHPDWAKKMGVPDEKKPSSVANDHKSDPYGSKKKDNHKSNPYD